MKAIPTTYNSIKYRSRLEARWAVFFDHLNFDFLYEPFTIKNNDAEYLPDFWVYSGFQNQNDVIIEIKPLTPNNEYIDHLCRVHDPAKSDILICVGDPNLAQPKGVWIKGIGTRTGEGKSMITFGFACLKCHVCGRFTINHWDLLQDGYPVLNCERLHHLNTGENKQAAEAAMEYRFDLEPTNVKAQV